MAMSKTQSVKALIIGQIQLKRRPAPLPSQPFLTRLAGVNAASPPSRWGLNLHLQLGSTKPMEVESVGNRQLAKLQTFYIRDLSIHRIGILAGETMIEHLHSIILPVFCQLLKGEGRRFNGQLTFLEDFFLSCFESRIRLVPFSRLKVTNIAWHLDRVSKSYFFHFSAMWSWVTYLTSLCLRVFIHKNNSFFLARPFLKFKWNETMNK